ncbi:hypothetical protein DFJ43DRAFT_1036270 [Lentinula guzmanii]|uniref:EF-hand domain-containing protein n=1 Tax=Lentinula guzmanii TaxID=2804957 RepID=A0AA38K0F4_9AGAR|nr:hypothetical protein DFJ43DRAFT_1215569 [Lentinula guzmanii]KAJ3736433.1 hypothetical protein DFJ43DRAFT_1036270 [Lentinula guzmanii]
MIEVKQFFKFYVIHTEFLSIVVIHVSMEAKFSIKKKILMAEDHVMEARKILTMYDTNGDNTLELNELVKLLEDLGSKICLLPPKLPPNKENISVESSTNWLRRGRG